MTDARYDRTLPGVGRLNRRYGDVSDDVRAGFRSAISELIYGGHLDTVRYIRDEKVPVLVVYDHWKRRALHLLRPADPGDVNLADHLSDWKVWALNHANRRTVETYEGMLHALIPLDDEGKPKPYPKSEFTKGAVSKALGALTCSGPTVRRYATAWSSFATFLVEREVLELNPMTAITLPRENAPREVWLAQDDVLRLVDAQAEPYRAFAALREGSGAEFGAAVLTKARDVDISRSSVHLHGTKTKHRRSNTRDRQAYVEPWAMERLTAYLKAGRFAPDALLFGDVTERMALKAQKAALKALGLREDYTLHDCRHSYAVAKMKAGAEPQLVASNLGHRDATMVLRIYGKYRPVAADIARLGVRVAK